MKTTVFLLTVFSIALILTGCGKTDGESYGQPIAGSELTDLKQILSEPDAFNGKTVTVEGTIALECPTGCWFDIQSGNAVVRVDIQPSGFVIPQKVNKTARVEGTVQAENGQVEIIGTGVKIK